MLFAIFPLFIGVTSVAQQVLRVDFGFNTLLMFGREWGAKGATIPGLMGLPAAVSWTLIAASILVVAARRTGSAGRLRSAASLAATTALLIGLLPLVGYIFGAENLYTIPRFTAIAFPTASMIVATSIAVLCNLGDVDPVRLFVERTAAGSMVRRVAPAVVAMPLVFGLLRLEGEEAGLYDSAFGTALRTIGEVVALVLLLLWTARAVRRQEALSNEIQAEVLENRVELLRLADAMPQVVWIGDSTGRVHYYNRRVENFGGIEQLGHSLFDWQPGMHPDDLASTQAAWETAVAEASTYTHEHRIMMADGSYRWHLSRAVPVLDADGQTQRWYGTATDIHDLKLAQESSQRAKERLRLAVEASTLGIWEGNPEKGDVFWDERVREIFGVGPDEPIDADKHVWGRIPPEEHAIMRIARQRALDPNGPGIYDVEHRVVRPDGATRWVHNTGRVVFEGEGRERRPVLMRGTTADVTERKLEETRMALLARLGDLIRTSSEQQELLYNVAKAVGETFNAKRCLFNEIDLERGVETVHRDYYSGLPSVAGEHDINEYSPVTSGEMVRGRTIVNHDSKADPRTAELYADVYEPAGERSYVAVPLLRGGVWVASLWISDDKPRIWTDAEVRTLESVGERTWLAVERLRNEEAQRDLNARFRLAQKAGRIGVWDWDVKSGRTFWSETMWEIYGREPESEVDADSWSEYLHPHDRERLLGSFEAFLRSPGVRYSDDFRIVRPDGSVRWVQVDAETVRDETGAPVSVNGVNVDITDRKVIEEKLRMNETRLRLITNALPALISYVDAEQRYTYVNATYTEWFRKTTDQIQGKTIREVLGPTAYKAVKPRIERALAGHEVHFEETLNYRGAGRRFVSISYVPDKGFDGETLGFYVLVHDLTELKRSQELLRSSEERLGMMLDAAVDYAIITTDLEGVIRTWNRGAEMIFGYAEADIVGSNIEILYSGDDVARGELVAEMREARQNDRMSCDRWMVRRDGSRFFASGSMMPLYVDTALDGYAKIVSDLTEKQRYAEALARANDALEERVASRTQELARSNEALMREISEKELAEQQRILLLRKLVSSQELERKRIARDIHDQLGQRLTALRLKIASLRELSSPYPEIAQRVERLSEISAKLDGEVSFLAWELRPSALDDLGFVNAIGEFVGEWSRHTDIHAEFHSNLLPGVRLDREVESHLYRVTQEALNNISKHAKANSVTVLLESRGDNLLLIVEDDGVGFDADSLGASDASGGLGLVGMGERAGIINGELEIESGEGAGTTIFLKVPFLPYYPVESGDTLQHDRENPQPA
jgi:PAS domain S-box-containing protein